MTVRSNDVGGPRAIVADRRDLPTGGGPSGTAPWLRTSAIALILANLLPVAGVLVLGWDVFALVLLYWFENVVIGAFNVFRMLWAHPDDIGRWIGKLFLIPFFIVHYGGFAAIHGLLVFAIFGGDTIQISGFIPPPRLVWQALAESGATYAALALVASHGFSFIRNYVAGGEYRRTTLERLMHRPYGRVIVLHVAIMLGGFVLLALGSPVPGLLLLIVLKTLADTKAHLRERTLLAE